MTISSTTSRNDYTAIAGQTVFPYTFKILVTSELKVYVDGVLKTETTHYTVSGATVATGGNVTFLTGLTVGQVVAIVDVPALTQLTSYSENDAFPAKTHENTLDKLTRIALYLKELLNKTISLPISSALTGLSLPTPVATYFLRWNAAGDGLENMDISTIGALSVAAYGKTLIDDTDASTALSTLGVSDFMKTVLDDSTSVTARATLGVSTASETLALVYPVGSIYTTIIPTNPATVFGFGTWAAFSTGRVLVGYDVSQAEFNTVEATGGEKAHTLTDGELPANVLTDTIKNYNLAGGSDFGKNSGGGNAHNNLQPYIVVYFWKRTA
jgi:hypothetical protein